MNSTLTDSINDLIHLTETYLNDEIDNQEIFKEDLTETISILRELGINQ